MTSCLEHVSQPLEGGVSQSEGDSGSGEENSATATDGVDTGPEQAVASGQHEPGAAIDQSLSCPDIILTFELQHLLPPHHYQLT